MKLASLNWKNVTGAVIAGLMITTLIIMFAYEPNDELAVIADGRCVSQEKAFADMLEHQLFPSLGLSGSLMGAVGDEHTDDHKFILSVKQNSNIWRIVVFREDDACAIAGGQGIRFFISPDSEKKDSKFF